MVERPVHMEESLGRILKRFAIDEYNKTLDQVLPLSKKETASLMGEIHLHKTKTFSEAEAILKEMGFNEPEPYKLSLHVNFDGEDVGEFHGLLKLRDGLSEFHFGAYVPYGRTYATKEAIAVRFPVKSLKPGYNNEIKKIMKDHPGIVVDLHRPVTSDELHLIIVSKGPITKERIKELHALVRKLREAVED